MTKLIKKIVSYFLLLTLFCGCLLVLIPHQQQQAKALCEDYEVGTDNTIYYFYDDCPTLSRTYLENAFFGESYSIVYDKQRNRSFTSLVNSGYFTGFGENCVVIIDIKKPFSEASILYNLFYSLKQQNCMTVLITSSGNLNPEVSNLTDAYIDLRITSDGGRVLDFVSNALTHFESYNTTESVDCEELYSETTIFIDDEFVYINNPLYINLEELYRNNSVLRIIVDRIIEVYDIDSSTNLTGFGSMLSALGIDLKIIVHVSQGVYVDILSGAIYDRSNLGDEQFFELTVSLYNCALTWCATDTYYYDFLWDLQDSGQIYVFEADPIQYNPDGIECCPDTTLAYLYGSQSMDAEDTLEKLLEMMHEKGLL